MKIEELIEKAIENIKNYQSSLYHLIDLGACCMCTDTIMLLTEALNLVQSNKNKSQEEIAMKETIKHMFPESEKPEIQQFKALANDMIETYIKKNHDYGNSFDESLNKFGLTASVVRMGDKMNRIESLVKKEALVKDESIKDTLMDLANYALMTVKWMNNNPEEKIK